MSRSNVAPAVRVERSLSTFIPFSAVHAEDPSGATVITINSDLVRTWRIKGKPVETAYPMDVERDKDALNIFIQAVGSDRVAIYHHVDQRKTKARRLWPTFINDYARHVHETYQNGLDGSTLLESELFLTVVYKMEADGAGGAFSKRSRTAREQKHRIGQSLKHMDKIGRQLEASLCEYGPVVLQDYQDRFGHTCSEALEFENYLLSGFWQPVLKPSMTPLWNYLGSASVFVGTDVVEVRRPDRSRFSQIVEIKDYANTTVPGMLNCLHYMNIEYVSCASYCTLQRRSADNKLASQERHLKITNHSEQAAKVGYLKSDVEDGACSLGEFTYSIRVSSDSIQGVRDDVAAVIAQFESMGYIAVTSGLATDSAFFSQVPGNFDDRTRIAHVTSLNFASFASMHSFHDGKARGNPWGNALMPLTTDSNRIVYLNLHDANNLNDLRGKMVPACTLLLGKTGEGKSTLLNMITCYLQQFHTEEKPLLDITLDYKQGNRKTTEALGGVYSQLKNGADTGYNPFKMDKTPNNCIFLDDLITYLCSLNGNVVTTSDARDIRQAVRNVMTLPRELRGFTTLLQNIASDGDENGIVERLKPWCSNDGTDRVGEYSWALDSENDSLDFAQSNVFGIDGTDFLGDEKSVTKTPMLMYILYRIQQVLGTRRVCLKIDEAFLWLNDPNAGPWIGKALATIRSLDGLLVLATQMPGTILRCSVGPEVLQQTATFLFLKNPSASWEEYEKFGMTEPEFAVMMDLERRHFLIKQDQTSWTGTLDLSGFGRDDLDILAGESA